MKNWKLKTNVLFRRWIILKSETFLVCERCEKKKCQINLKLYFHRMLDILCLVASLYLNWLLPGILLNRFLYASTWNRLLYKKLCKLAVVLYFPENECYISEKLVGVAILIRISENRNTEKEQKMLSWNSITYKLKKQFLYPKKAFKKWIANKNMYFINWIHFI